MRSRLYSQVQLLLPLMATGLYVCLRLGPLFLRLALFENQSDSLLGRVHRSTLL